eukprot:CAMPEP_0179979728 /NCGR_PEP_ID=MMETSP0983-20121128/41521_1 /TAXON_ID=483367 /ORGANISM="non described non described, Strain CCMP 2436" /LENGTH=1012 /DNA_ID=CAMNT_0021897549 /DNA_START=28 /DNA_END=3065 /DNA_ORIENTATION=-
MTIHGPVTLQVLGTGGPDTSPCLLLHLPRKKGMTCYLVNSGEGMQRLCGEQHVRLSGRLQRILLTSLDATTVGGLPGLLITLADASHGRPVPVTGPVGTAGIVSASSGFMPSHARSTLVEEVGAGPSSAPLADDDGVRIFAFVVDAEVGCDQVSELGSAAAHCAPAGELPAALGSADGGQADGGLGLLESSPAGEAGEVAALGVGAADNGAVPTSKRRRLTPTGADGAHPRGVRGQAVSYAFELPAALGKFNAKRAAELNISGPDRGRLCKGESVTLPSGVIVRPEELLAAGTPPQLLLVLACPTVEHARALATHAPLLELVASKTVVACAHICDSDVWHSSEMGVLCALLGSEADHLVLSTALRPAEHVFVSGARLQTLLHAIHPLVYPLPHALLQGTQPAAALAPDRAAEAAAAAGTTGGGVHAARLLARLTASPVERRGLDESECTRLRNWTNSRGEAQSLDVEHITATLRAVGGLALAVSQLPAALHFEPKPAGKEAGQKEGEAATNGQAAYGQADGGEHGRFDTGGGDSRGAGHCELRRLGEAEAREQPSGAVLACDPPAPDPALAALPDFPPLPLPDSSLPLPDSCFLLDSPFAPLPDSLTAAAEAGLLEGGEVTFLGTGAAMPSKYRNVSATLLHLPAGGCVLLDCGEGTLGQLRRRYGLEGAANVLARVRCFWVSHAHADHHLGLPSLLVERARAVRTSNAQLREGGSFLEGNDSFLGGGAFALEPAAALVVGPRRLEPWLRACAPAVLSLDDFEFGHCSQVHALLPALDMQAGSRLGVCAAVAVHVEHCADAWALLLTVRSSDGRQGRSETGGGLVRARMETDGTTEPGAGVPRSLDEETGGGSGDGSRGGSVEWSLGYSGDTRPCDSLVKAALKVPHLLALIHEATFEDELGGEAVARRHATISEALTVGKQAGAYRTLLTHFSQRYPKVASAGGECAAELSRAAFATDLMSVPLRLLRWIPAITKPAQLLLTSECADEDKAPSTGPGLGPAGEVPSAAAEM